MCSWSPPPSGRGHPINQAGKRDPPTTAAVPSQAQHIAQPLPTAGAPRPGGKLDGSGEGQTESRDPLAVVAAITVPGKGQHPGSHSPQLEPSTPGTGRGTHLPLLSPADLEPRGNPRIASALLQPAAPGGDCVGYWARPGRAAVADRSPSLPVPYLVPLDELYSMGASSHALPPCFSPIV